MILKIIAGLILFLFITLWCIIILSIGIATGIKLSKGRKNGLKKGERESL